LFAALQSRARAAEAAEAAAKLEAEEAAKYPNRRPESPISMESSRQNKAKEENLSLAKYLDTRAAAAATSNSDM